MKPLFTLHKVRFISSGQRAMTLVEVCLSIGIASFAAIPIMGVLAISMNNMSESTDRSIFSRLYHTVAEAGKAAAESSGGEEGWTTTLAFDRDLVPCTESDSSAQYKVVCVGTDAANLPGISDAPAWQAAITITDIPKNRVVFMRSTLLVKEPVFTQNGSAD